MQLNPVKLNVLSSRYFFTLFVYRGYCVTYLFIYLRFYVTFNTLHIISRWIVLQAEENSTYSGQGSVLLTANHR